MGDMRGRCARAVSVNRPKPVQNPTASNEASSSNITEPAGRAPIALLESNTLRLTRPMPRAAITSRPGKSSGDRCQKACRHALCSCRSCCWIQQCAIFRAVSNTGVSWLIAPQMKLPSSRMKRPLSRYARLADTCARRQEGQMFANPLKLRGHGHQLPGRAPLRCLVLSAW